jgi:fido (protein-threonine AMPylation protein)
MAGDPTGDPYLLPNLTLRNKFGVDDRSELERLEADSVALRFAVLLTKPLLPPYSFETLKTIHGFLFADAYDWAGAPRVTDLAKRQFDDADSDPVFFVRHGLIEPAAN